VDNCRGLDESHFRKLFLRRSVAMVRKRELELALRVAPEPLALDAPKDYDYDNENDASYCPNNLPVSTFALAAPANPSAFIVMLHFQPYFALIKF
jgi:hypothetical protein